MAATSPGSVSGSKAQKHSLSRTGPDCPESFKYSPIHLPQQVFNQACEEGRSPHHQRRNRTGYCRHDRPQCASRCSRCARTSEWLAITGALLRATTCCSPCGVSCETSMTIPSSFSLATACMPRGDNPWCSTAGSPVGREESAHSLLPACVSPNPHTRIVEGIDTREIGSQRPGIQEALNDRHLPGSLNVLNIIRAERQRDPIQVLLQKP